MRFIVVICAGTTILSACSTLSRLSDIKPEPTHVSALESTPIAARWSETAPDDLPTTDWIGSFSDETLVALTYEALEANANIREAAARLEAAQARARIANAERLPSVNSSSSASRNGNVGFGSGASSLSSNLTASWEADLWGRIRDDIDTATLEVDATNADYAAVRLSVAGQVSQGWFDVIEARLLVELSVRDVETQERGLRLTQNRFEGGLTEASDVRLARSAVADAQALQASRRQALSAAVRSLEILLRRYPAEEITASNDLPVLPPLSGVATPEYILRKRPDLLAAEHRLLAQGLQIDVARKNLLPRLTLDGSGSLSGTALNNLFDIDAVLGQIAAGLAGPIYQGGALRADVRQQEALLRQLLENYADTALSAYLEVENTLDAEQRLAERETALRTSLNEALEAEKRLEIRYTEGLVTILQLLDAQSRRLSAEAMLISARKERLVNRVRMHVALGGGFETNTGVEPYSTVQALRKNG